MAIEQFPFVSVSGAPYERGRQYGTALRDRVKASAALYGKTLDDLGYDQGRKTAVIKTFAAQIDAFGGHYLEEMRGISDGAGIPFEDVVMINARTEVIAQARREAENADPEDDPDDGCTGAVILGERSATGGVIHGQNWDWRAECAETAIVLRVRRDDGPDFLTVAHTPQGAGAGAFRHGHARGRDHAQGRLQQHDAEHGRGLCHRFRMCPGRGVPHISGRWPDRACQSLAEPDRPVEAQGNRHPERAGELLPRLAGAQAVGPGRAEAHAR
jgi:hypothetical protein